ncbi:RNA-binding protein, putative [Trypanosoma cruzi marinkellei]|uniref:RNA-binding protein, putative n=1 Tax=Trypanosoma cruzi marinkellei TaxID=85056 RepID=K2NE17_TRYCR|nr:RNA-binding protein, putative [Trypanosoma cruzi marinkellei]
MPAKSSNKSASKPAAKPAAKAPAPKAEKKGAAKAPAPKAAAPAPKAAAAAPKPAVRDAKQRSDAVNHNGLYVKNWGQGSVDDAKALFGTAGKVVGVRIRRRRYAIIFFENAAAVKKAIDLFNGKEFMGNVLSVVPAKTTPKPDPHANSSVVFVSPIFRASTTKKQILELFSGMKVLRLRTYRSNYAYVYLDTPAAAQRAVKEKNGAEFRGKQLRVALSTRSLAKDRARAERARLLMAAQKFNKRKTHTK